MFGAQGVKPIKNYEFNIVVRLLQDEVDESSRGSYRSTISCDRRHGPNAQTFNCGGMLSQTGEGCGRLVLHRMRRCVQKFENATNPSRLGVDALIRLSDKDQVGQAGHSPDESNHSCSLSGSHL
jgi:hypothetical protein